MSEIAPKSRVSIVEFRNKLYAHLKEHNLRYSDQRERILKLLYLQSTALDVDGITRKLNSEKPKSASYATVLRQMKFFADLGFVYVSSQNRYLLKQSL